MSKVIKEFSRFAHQYDQYNEIQSQVAKTLVSMLPKKIYKSILDLGCGSGAVAKNLHERNFTCEHFTAFDSSSSMLAIHPDAANIIKVCGDFNDRHFPGSLPQREYGLLLSSSALQWSTNLDRTFAALSNLAPHAYFAIFTSGTFKTLHRLAKVNSPIYSREEIEKHIKKYYDDANFTLHSYTLSFDSVREMFRYIKKSGVSAGEKKLEFKETKRLMESYPLDHLEFEVLFIEAKTI